MTAIRQYPVGVVPVEAAALSIRLPTVSVTRSMMERIFLAVFMVAECTVTSYELQTKSNSTFYFVRKVFRGQGFGFPAGSPVAGSLFPFRLAATSHQCRLVRPASGVRRSNSRPTRR